MGCLYRSTLVHSFLERRAESGHCVISSRERSELKEKKLMSRSLTWNERLEQYEKD